MYQEILKLLKAYEEPKYAEWLKPFIRFDEYQNEELLGVRVPTLRKLAKNYKNIDKNDLIKILHSNIHEMRLLAVFIMVLKSKKEPIEMCEIYLENLDYINNWDIIDYTAPHIVSPNISKNKLKELANSNYLWANRVAMVSMIYFIKQRDFNLTLEFAKKFMYHKHHLMHKAAGWMLREIGKVDINVLKDFLKENEKNMPAIMRSYATEHLKTHQSTNSKI